MNDLMLIGIGLVVVLLVLTGVALTVRKFRTIPRCQKAVLFTGAAQAQPDARCASPGAATQKS